MDFQAIREKQESDIRLLQNQISHFQSTLDGLQNDQTQLEQQIETLTNQLKEHEISVETCVSVLEEKYAKQHKDLIDQVERDQAAFQQLKQDIATKSKYMIDQCNMNRCRVSTDYQSNRTNNQRLKNTNN